MAGGAIKRDSGAARASEAVPHDGLKERAKLACERARTHGLADGEDKPSDPERVVAMDSALMRLSQLERDVFLAMRVDHLTIEEIAGRIGISSDEARRIFVRAFGNLEGNMAKPHRNWWRQWLW